MSEKSILPIAIFSIVLLGVIFIPMDPKQPTQKMTTFVIGPGQIHDDIVFGAQKDNFFVNTGSAIEFFVLWQPVDSLPGRPRARVMPDMRDTVAKILERGDSVRIWATLPTDEAGRLYRVDSFGVVSTRQWKR